MKQMKKVMAVIFAVILALSMTVTASAAGEEGSITIQRGEKNLNGVTFEAYRLLDITSVDKESGKIDFAINDNFKEFFKDKGVTTAAEAYNYIILADLTTLRNELKTATASIDPVKTVTGESGKDVIISGLEYGYYIIISGVDSISPNLALLDSSMKNVVVKGSEPTVDKEANGEDNTAAQVGETVSFTVYSTVPQIPEEDENDEVITQYYYKLLDTMSSGLDFVDGSVRVYIGGKVIDDDNYNVTSSKNSVTKETNLTIEIKNFIDYKVDAGKTIAIIYKATLNENAIISDVENNKAFAQYGNDPAFTGEGTTTTNTDVVNIYDFNLTIKNTIFDGSSIGGGVFNVTGSDDKLIKFAKPDGKDYYVVDENGSENITLPNEGTITIRGLDEGSYEVTQVTPPADYPYLVTPKTVTIEFDANELISDKTAEFVNDNGPGLPSTGGMGTVIFTVAGLALIAAVAGSFIISRRKKNS